MPSTTPPAPPAGSRDLSGADARPMLGIDIGGTKIAAGVVTPAGTQLAAGRIPTRAQEESPEQTVGRLKDLIRTLLAQAGVGSGGLAGIGIGSPGPLDTAEGSIKGPTNLPGWKHVLIGPILQQEFGAPAFLDNDANAAAVGEHRFGAGRGVANLVYVTISTGIGGGIIVNDRLYQGENGNAGELGHMSVAYDGRPCKCGNLGCIEAYASGTAIGVRAREAVAAGTEGAGDSSLAKLPGGPTAITGSTVVDAVKAGDPFALRHWDQTMRILGIAMANFINLFNPRRIIVGGGISNAGDLLFNPLRQYTFQYAMPLLKDVVDVVPAELGNDVGVLGAAGVALASVGSK